MSTYRKERNEEILKLKQEGKSNNELGRLYQLTPQRISKIFHREIEKMRKEIRKNNEKI
jgi:Mor family transcriptional regulator